MSLAPSTPQEMAAAAREASEIAAAMQTAMAMPRSEEDAYARLERSCGSAKFADGCRYSFPRGGSIISGPSVKLAREAARCFRNIRYGFRITGQDPVDIYIVGYAIDLETNVTQTAEVTFKRLIYRKSRGWIEPDERDFRELCNRHGAIAERNAILKIMPPWLVDDALETVDRTMAAAAKQEMKDDPKAAGRKLVAAFDHIGVSREMVETRLGHPIDLLTADELHELRGIYHAIRENQATREEFFEVPDAPQRNKTLDDLTSEMQNDEPEPEPAK